MAQPIFSDGSYVEPLQAASFNYLTSYMDEYYAHLTDENLLIGEFLCKAMRRPSVGRAVVRLLDVACGPSAYYWALTESAATEVCCLDIRDDSMQYLRGVVQDCLDGKVEERYFEVAATFAPHGDAVRYMQAVAKRFRSFDVHDIVTPWPYPDASFETVVSCFGMDHVEKESEFAAVLAQACRVLVDGGTLTLVTLCETDSWRSGETVCACLYMDAALLRTHLAQAGFRVVEMTEQKAMTAIENSQGYSKMIFCQAVKV